MAARNRSRRRDTIISTIKTMGYLIVSCCDRSRRHERLEVVDNITQFYQVMGLYTVSYGDLIL